MGSMIKAIYIAVIVLTIVRLGIRLDYALMTIRQRQCLKYLYSTKWIEVQNSCFT